jgi:hypothetical protein
MQEMLFNYPGLDIREASVFDLVFDRSSSIRTGVDVWGKITGVQLGNFLTVIVSSFLNYFRTQILGMLLIVPLWLYVLELFSQEKYMSASSPF